MNNDKTFERLVGELGEVHRSYEEFAWVAFGAILFVLLIVMCTCAFRLLRRAK